MVNQISDCKFASSETSASFHDENLGARDGDVQLADVVANHAGTGEEIYEQEGTVIRIVRRNAANFKSPNSPQSPVSIHGRPHSSRMSWRCPFHFSTLRNGTRCAFRWVG